MPRIWSNQESKAVLQEQTDYEGDSFVTNDGEIDNNPPVEDGSINGEDNVDPVNVDVEKIEQAKRENAEAGVERLQVGFGGKEYTTAQHYSMLSKSEKKKANDIHRKVNHVVLT